MRGARGPIPRYCSAACRARAATERARGDGRLDQWTAAQAERRRKPSTSLVCPYCRKPFTTTRPKTARSCRSKRCVRAYNRARMRLYNEKRSIASLARPKKVAA